MINLLDNNSDLKNSQHCCEKLNEFFELETNL